MKQYVFVLILISIFSSVSFAAIGYDIETKDNQLNVVTTIILESQTNIDIYNLSWTLPKDSRVISIEDESGQIKSYTVDNNEVTFVTNPDDDKRKEIVSIKTVQYNIFNYTFYPFGFIDVTLPAFENDKTIVNANISNLITTSIPYEFTIADNLKMEGFGPISFRAFSGNVKENGYYYAFPDRDISSANENYGLVAGTIGIIPFYTKFPLLIDSENRYNEIAESYSSGTYRTGGIIIVKDTDNIVPVILHETVHAYNSQIMNWKENKGAWFDEGTAQYVEWLGNIKLKQRVPNLFGSPNVYREGKYIYTLKPHGDREMLWDYYNSGADFIKSWKPDDENRDFGYALSELIIRKFVMESSPEALHNVYQKLSQVNHLVVSDSEFINIVGMNMKPCYNENKDAFEKCLDDVNAFEPRILTYIGDIENKKSSSSIKTFEETYGSFDYLKNQTKQAEPLLTQSKSILDSMIEAIINLFKNIFG